MSRYILIFLLFLLQFFYFPIGKSFFEGSKVYLAEVLIVVLLALQLLSKGGFSLKYYKKPVMWSFALLTGLTVSHLIFHQSATVLFGNEFRLQGTFLLWMLMIFALVSAKIDIEDKIKPLFISAILFVQLVCTVLFIGVGADRPVGTIGEPNALAANVLFLWPFLVFPWPKKTSERSFSILGILCALIILFVSGSRSGIIGLGVQVSFIGLYFLLVRFNTKKKKAIATAAIISVILFITTLITPFIGPGTEYEDRGEIWKAAVHAGLAYPVAGVGFGNAAEAYHKANLELNNVLQGYHVDSAHNIFLDWFVQAGVLGLGILLFLLAQTILTSIRLQQKRNLVLLLGVVTALSFNPASVVSFIALWWLIGKGTKLFAGK